MGQSFYLTRNYSQLRNASQTFSDLINAGATSYGLTMLQATSYKTLNDSYVAKFLLADAPQRGPRPRFWIATPLRFVEGEASTLAKIVEATHDCHGRAEGDISG